METSAAIRDPSRPEIRPRRFGLVIGKDQDPPVTACQGHQGCGFRIPFATVIGLAAANPRKTVLKAYKKRHKTTPVLLNPRRPNFDSKTGTKSSLETSPIKK